MNGAQKTIVFVALLLGVAMLLVLPVGDPTEYGKMSARGYRLAWNTDGYSTDTIRLLIQFGILAFAVWAGLRMKAK